LNRFEFRWQNFRGFESTGWVDVRPITIFVGSNNTGKSSLIAPLLLLKQTVRSRTPDVPLVSRGELANVGSFRDFVFRHELDRSVSFDLRMHSHKPDGDEEPLGRYAPGELRTEFSAEQGNIVLNRYQVYDIFRRLYLSRKRTATGRYTLTGLTLPRAAAGNRRAAQSDAAARSEHPHHFLFRGMSVIEAQLEQSRHLESDDRDEPTETAPGFDVSEWAREYYQVASTTSAMVNTLLRETSYLGPLREPLRRVYELSGDPPRDVGTRGEFAPELLYRNEDQLSEFRHWLSVFGLGRSIRATPSREDAFSLYFPAGGGRPSVNLADVGFGASQILPMIVQGITAAEGQLLMMEQPEIHLNPRLQSRIADFLAFMASTDKGVIVETHSEHLLLRLRTLMASGEIDDDDVAIYFVDREKGRSRVRPIPVRANGYIAPSDWPRGFFQDSVREALALATEQERSRGSS
jgi:hypothetical protein